VNGGDAHFILDVGNVMPHVGTGTNVDQYTDQFVGQSLSSPLILNFILSAGLRGRRR
jgi:hypothetical protein